MALVSTTADPTPGGAAQAAAQVVVPPAHATAEEAVPDKDRCPSCRTEYSPKYSSHRVEGYEDDHILSRCAECCHQVLTKDGGVVPCPCGSPHGVRRFESRSRIGHPLPPASAPVATGASITIELASGLSDDCISKLVGAMPLPGAVVVDPAQHWTEEVWRAGRQGENTTIVVTTHPGAPIHGLREGSR